MMTVTRNREGGVEPNLGKKMAEPNLGKKNTFNCSCSWATSTLKLPVGFRGLGWMALVGFFSMLIKKLGMKHMGI